MSSVSTRHRPRRRASRRPTEDFPAPMNPTSTMLSVDIASMLPDRVPGSHGTPERRPAEGTARHPTTGALAEVVVDTGLDPGSDQERDALNWSHEARLVQGDPDGVSRAKPEQRLLIGDVPPSIAGADPVGDAEPMGQA